MKKNLMSVLILALVLVNLVFTAILTFTIVPSLKNSNDLIADVATAIDLDLNAGKSTGLNNVAVKDIETYNVSEGNSMTIGLKKGADGEDHFCVASFYISMDKTNEDYKNYSAEVSKKESMIKNEIITVISSYTKEELTNSEMQLEIREELLDSMRRLFDSDFIIDVGFDELLCQ